MQQTHWTLRQPTAQPHLLADEVRRHLLPWLSWMEHRQNPWQSQYTQDEQNSQRSNAHDTGDEYNTIEDLRLILEELRPALPQQQTLAPLEPSWRLPSQTSARQQTLQTLAETLARRHHSSFLLMRSQVAYPDAIFSEERFHLRSIEDIENIEGIEDDEQDRQRTPDHSPRANHSTPTRRMISGAERTVSSA